MICLRCLEILSKTKEQFDLLLKMASEKKASKRQLGSWEILRTNVPWFILMIRYFAVIVEQQLHSSTFYEKPTSDEVYQILEIIYNRGTSFISSLLGESRMFKPAITAFICFSELPTVPKIDYSGMLKTGDIEVLSGQLKTYLRQFE